MPLTYSISEPENLILVRPTGTVTSPEVLEFIEELLSDPALKPGMKILSDHTEVKRVMPGTELREIAVRARQLMDRGIARIALVAPNDFLYGIGRMFVSYSEFTNVKVEVFREKEDARRWLGLTK